MSQTASSKNVLAPATHEGLTQKLRRTIGEEKFELLRLRAFRLMAAAAWLDAGDLIKLAKLFRSDKWGCHWYAQHYQRHFAPLRHKRMLIIEIGVGGYDNPRRGGESLRMWKWFFPRSQIVGIDIYDKRPINEPRIRTFKGSQVDAEFLNHVISEVGRPDIVVDDGSHLNRHVIETFHLLFPHLKDDGCYVVEDTQTSYWPTWGGAMPEKACSVPSGTIQNFFKGLIDGINHQEFLIPGYEPNYYERHVTALSFYHNMIFVQKGFNNERSNLVRNGRLDDMNERLGRELDEIDRQWCGAL